MKRSHRFAQPKGTVVCQLPGGESVEIPVAQGILKHPSLPALFELLQDPQVVRLYTVEALRVAPWSLLKAFPGWWLLECLPEADLHEGRAKAVKFMLRAQGDTDEREGMRSA